VKGGDSKKRRRRRAAPDRREEILQAAQRVFARYGYHGTRTHHISQEIDVSEGLIFRYFPSKEAILATLVEEGSALLEKDMAPILEAPDEADVEAVLQTVAQRYLGAIERNRDFIALWLAEQAYNPQINKAVQPVMEGLVRGLADYLAERQQLGFLRSDLDTKTAARVFWAILFYYTLPLTFQPETAPDMRHVLRTAVSIIFHGTKR
jgi:AcrR family transcriptional regulator